MKILNIEIACMSETFNGTFIDQLIPEYNNKLVFTQQGKELYLELLQNFYYYNHLHYNLFFQEYSYIVTAYQMVVAEKYVYRDIEIIEPTDTAPAGAAGEGLRNRARIDVYVVPSIKLVEIPLFVSTGRILDNPPMPPVVKR